MSEIKTSTNEIDNQATVGAAASGVSEEGFAVGELADDRKCEGTGKEEVSGVTKGITEVENCIIWCRKCRAAEAEEEEDRKRIHGNWQESVEAGRLGWV